MMDLTRAADELPAYNQEDEPNGLIDMTSSINTIMSEEDQKYIAKVLDPDDVSRGQFASMADFRRSELKFSRSAIWPCRWFPRASRGDCEILKSSLSSKPSSPAH